VLRPCLQLLQVRRLQVLELLPHVQQQLVRVLRLPLQALHVLVVLRRGRGPSQVLLDTL